jgi:hypothetical protein
MDQPEVITLSTFVTSLISAAVGALLAVGSSLLTLHIQTINAREQRKEQNSREDRYRLFDKRLQAYASLYLKIGKARGALATLARNPESKDHLSSARVSRNEYWECYTIVRLIGSDEVFRIADRFLTWIDDGIRHITFDRATFQALLNSFTDTVRRELITPPSGYERSRVHM